VTDLSLAPGGQRVAFVTAGSQGSQVQLVELGREGPGAPKIASQLEDPADRRLAWNGRGDLVLWQPATSEQRAFSSALFAEGRSQVVWSGSAGLPASIDRSAPLPWGQRDPRQALEPADLSDEAETLWLGRSFAVEHGVDASTGLAADRLVVTRETGSRYALDLPGEACGGPRYGRPQYRIGVGGRVALDLRFVEGGCHAVAIDLESGQWARLDRSREPATCRAQRNVPPAQLQTALRGWSRDVDAALSNAGADRGASYAIHITEDGRTRVHARTYDGSPLDVMAPDFPLTTPLRRIDVTHVAPHTRGERRFTQPGPASLEPL
jgi:hypothetical protein